MTAGGPLASFATATLSPEAARALAAVAAGVFGLLLGSFLNVVVYRVPRGLSVVHPGSFCPTCETPVRSYDNIPVVSWLVLRGRCRSCRSPISVRYPLVEALTGALFVAVALIVGPYRSVPAYCVLAATFLALAAIDLDRQPSPPGVSLVGAAVALALLAWPAAGTAGWHAFVLALVTGAGASAVAGGLWAVARGAEHGRARSGAPFALVPLGVLLGWLGQGRPGSGAAGAAVALAGAVVAGRSLHRRQGAGAGPWWLVLGLPVGCGAGAVAAFAVAAAQGALTGG
jgi:leader peptidase (prepilin peptidase)/N-methyltransferase